MKKNILNRVLLSSVVLSSLLLADTSTQRINVLVIKDKGFTSDWKTSSTNLNTRITNNDPIAINNYKKPNAKKAPSITVVDTNCNKNAGETCTIIFKATDTDGTFVSWSVNGRSRLLKNASFSNLDENGVFSGYTKSFTFTVPRSGTNVEITANRTDNDGLSSPIKSYTFTSLSDKFTEFKNVLVNKCGIDGTTVDSNFDKVTGMYGDTLFCGGVGLTDSDLDKFIVLKGISDLYLDNNQLTNVNGLSNLSVASNFLDLMNNQLTNVNGLSKLTSLNVLQLDKNQLTNVNGLSNLTSVSTLSLSNNYITNISGLSNLTTVYNYLYIDGNPLLENLTPISSSTIGSILIDNRVYSIGVNPSSIFCSNPSLFISDRDWNNLPYSNVCY